MATPRNISPGLDRSEREAQLADVVELVRSRLRLTAVGPGRKGRVRLRRRPGDKGGAVEAATCSVGSSDVVVHLDIGRLPVDAPVSASGLFNRLAAFSHFVRVLPVEESAPGEVGLRLELRVGLQPLDPFRRSTLSGELDCAVALAELLKMERDQRLDEAALLEAYKGVEEILDPVMPLYLDHEDLVEWADWTADALLAGLAVSVPGRSGVESELASRVLSGRLMAHGQSLGRVKLPRIDPAGILKMADAAPGLVSASATQLCGSTHSYHRHEELRSALTQLRSRSAGVLLTGSWDEQQSAFHGGQGASVDGTLPVIARVPPLPLDLVLRVLAHEASTGGSSTAGEEPEAVVLRVQDALEGLPEAAALSLAVPAVRYAALVGAGGSVKTFVGNLAGSRESYGGLSSTRLRRRCDEVAARFVEVLAGAELKRFLAEAIVGQDKALRHLVRRLRTEALTRPDHQPLRVLLQGPPAVGKSEVVKVISRLLGMPLVRIDAGAWPDHYTAAATLRGAGRGIVMSDRPGELERAAKQHGGAILELADLDHANPRARSAIADLFLEPLDEGEVRTGTGAAVSTANLLIVFTVNLGGEETRVHRTTHFGGRVTARDADRKIHAELEYLTSPAWLSRMGRPVIFHPLAEASLERIAARAVSASAGTAAARASGGAFGVDVAPGVGQLVVRTSGASMDVTGARGLAEHARSLTADALADLDLAGRERGTLRIAAGEGDDRLVAHVT